MGSTLACFITAHGFGHAARASAVLAQLALLEPDLEIHLYTQVPYRFFEQSLAGGFEYHELDVDLGLIQTSALKVDLPQSLAALRSRLPFKTEWVTQLAEELKQINANFVLADIAPLGLLVARQAQIPSFLLENFTWDWIYQSYKEYDQAYVQLAVYLKGLFDLADWHIQGEPFCQEFSGALVTEPIARNSRKTRLETRIQLGLQPDQRLCLLTLGGWGGAHLGPPRGRLEKSWVFVSPGASQQVEQVGNWIKLPKESEFYHPDLMAAADLVVTKLGYSTIAEAWVSQTPMLYLARPDYVESAPLEAWVKKNIPSGRIAWKKIAQGNWANQLNEIVLVPKGPPRRGGASIAAQWIFEKLHERKKEIPDFGGR